MATAIKSRPTPARSHSTMRFLGAFAIGMISIALAVPYMAVHYTLLFPISPERVKADGGKTVQLSDGRVLEYFEYGHPNGTPVLLLHGSLSTGKFWAFLHFNAWVERWRLICPSIPGWGLSDSTEATPSAFACDMEALLTEVGVSAEFSVAGYSMGASYAAALATDNRMRNRISALAVFMGGPISVFDLLRPPYTSIEEYIPLLSYGVLRSLSVAALRIPFAREFLAHAIVRSALWSDVSGFLERNVDGFESVQRHCPTFATALEADAVRSLSRTTRGYVNSAAFSSHVSWTDIPTHWRGNRAVLLLGKRDVLLPAATSHVQLHRSNQTLLTQDGGHLACPPPFLAALRHLLGARTA